MTPEEEVRQIVINLVTLAIKTNNVVTQGSFPGSISDDVDSLLKFCKEVHDEYVVTGDSTGRTTD